jgi:MFS family permease
LTPVRASRFPFRLVALMMALSFMSYFDRTIMSIAGPGILKEFSLSETQMGSVYSAFLLSYALVMIPAGFLADRFGAKRVLTWMSLGAACFTALTAAGGHPLLAGLVGVVPSFVLIRLALGVVTAPLYPSCAKMNAQHAAGVHRARIQGWISAGAGVGGAISPFIFTALIAGAGWRAGFCIAGLVTAALAFVWSRFAPQAPEAAPAIRMKTPWRELWRNRSLMLLTVSYALVCYFEYIFFYWLYYYFGEIRRVPAATTAMYTSGLFVAFTLMTPAGGWLSDRLASRYGLTRGRRIVSMAGLTLSAALLFLAIEAPQAWVAALLLAAALGVASASDGPYWAAAVELGGEHAGAAGGILNTGGNLGGFFGPIVTPLIAAYAGWSWALGAASILVLVAVALWPFIDLGRSNREMSVAAPQLSRA